MDSKNADRLTDIQRLGFLTHDFLFDGLLLNK